MSTIAQSLQTALAHHQSGQVVQAEAIYRQVLSVEPNHAQALKLLGVARLQQGAVAEAEAHLRASLAIEPRHAAAHDNLGVVLVNAGRLEEAIASFREAVRLAPGSAASWSNLGNALLKAKQAGEAAGALFQARQLDPRSATICFELGNAFMMLLRFEEAAAEFRAALEIKPDYAQANVNLGSVLNRLERLDEALEYFHAALRLRPNYAKAESNLAVVLTELGRYDEALAAADRALALEPKLAVAHNNRGLALLKPGRLEAAVASFERALAIDPEYASAHRNRAVVWLLQGDYARGWPEFLWRWRMADYPPHGRSEPLWDGGPLAGRTIVLHAEQGLGDTMQFVRYAALVRARGGRVVFQGPAALRTLLARTPGIDEYPGPDDPPPTGDVRAALLDLPALCGTTFETVPAQMPYIAVDERLVARWRGELAGRPGFKIGINWQGNRQYRGDRYRSIPLSLFAPLGDLPGVELVSLQKGPGSEQLSTVDFSVWDLGSRLDETSGAFVETAAVMQAVDLVVTSDTATAHLAGALGVPVWVALQATPDWRWGLEGDSTPWYPRMRLFRQSRWDGWPAVFEQMTAELTTLLGQRDYER